MLLIIIYNLLELLIFNLNLNLMKYSIYLCKWVPLQDYNTLVGLGLESAATKVTTSK